MDKKSALDLMKLDLAKQRESKLRRLRENYRLARDLGFTSEEAAYLSHKGIAFIRALSASGASQKS